MEGWFYNLEVIVGGTSVALKGLSGDTGVFIFSAATHYMDRSVS